MVAERGGNAMPQQPPQLRVRKMFGRRQPWEIQIRTGGEVRDDLLTGAIEEVAEKARRILTEICPEAWCQEQEWDNRIDFGVKQPDGKVVSEWIVLGELTEKLVRECGARLRLRQKGIPVDLKNEIPPPIYIGGGRGRPSN